MDPVVMKEPRKFALLSLFVFASTAIAAIPTSSANAAVGDCPSGYMCLWSKANYTGTFVKISASESYRPISLTTVESYYNRRTKRTWLHEKADGSGDHVCLAPGQKKASGLSGWMDNPKAVWLATPVNC